MKTFTAKDMKDYGDYTARLCTAHIITDFEKWCKERFKPAKEVIDLSVLIDGIECLFWDDENDKSIYELAGIRDSKYPYASINDRTRFCQPRMNHIHAWQGGDCPVPEGFMVKVWVRGDRKAMPLGYVANWNHNKMNQYDDIIAFEVVGLEDGYVMPWESE